MQRFSFSSRSCVYKFPATVMIWHNAAGETTMQSGVESSWLLIRVGYPALPPGTVMTQRSVTLRADGGLKTMNLTMSSACFKGTGRQRRELVDGGDRHYSPPLSRSPPSLPFYLRCSRIHPETNADQYLLPWLPRGCKDCCKAFLFSPLCLETMVLTATPPPPSSLPPPTVTLLHSLGSADRCLVKHALIHKTHSVLMLQDYLR